LHEHLNQEQFEDYRQRHLQAAELLNVSEHLGECEPCRRRLESEIKGDASFLAVESQLFDEHEMLRVHLTEEQISQCVDSNLDGDESQLVTDHLTICDRCTHAMDDLRDFRNEIAPTLEREYQPATTASPGRGWWERIVAFLPNVFRESPVPAFASALAIFLLALAAWVGWRDRPQATPPQQAVASPTPRLQPVPSLQPTSSPAQLESVGVIAQLNDGAGVLTLDQNGKLSGVDDLPPAFQNLVKGALTGKQLGRSSQLKGLSRPSSSLMGSDNEKTALSVIEPLGSVLLTAQPTFRWSALKGASSYVVEVYDEQFKLVATSPQLTNHTWKAPQSLSRGKVYAWQVKASKDGQEITSPRPPAPQAKFRVLDQSTANDLLKAKRAYPSSHLALGLLYAEAGLLNESEQELRALQKANPKSELARSLLRQVQALRRP
jgi:hypothetical protein